MTKGRAESVTEQTNEQALAVRETADLVEGADRRTLAIVRQQLMPGANDAELGFFLAYCEATGLDPVARQIFPIRTWDRDNNRYRYEFHIGVDGLRLIAARTGLYAGQTTVWCGPDGQWRDVWLDDKVPPSAAKTTVFRKGAQPVSRVARWREFVRLGRNGAPLGAWATHPAHMIALASERHALRAAFPKETAGHRVDLTDPDLPPQIADPDAPLSNRQLGRLHALAKDLGWSDDERHAMAGVESFSDLTRGEAHALIDAWLRLLEGENDAEVAEGNDWPEDREIVDAELVEDVADAAAPEAASGPGSDVGREGETSEGEAAPDADGGADDEPEVVAPSDPSIGAGSGEPPEHVYQGDGDEPCLAEFDGLRCGYDVRVDLHVSPTKARQGRLA